LQQICSSVEAGGVTVIDLKNIFSLSDFQRRTREHMLRLKRTGLPAVLTVNGKAELVVQDAASYQALLDALDRAESQAGIRRGLKSMEQGDGRLAADVMADIRKQRKIPDP
jgi:PHD/YefM family antitoxin component YafN of YafNO toxin-antitoxin module